MTFLLKQEIYRQKNVDSELFVSSLSQTKGGQVSILFTTTEKTHFTCLLLPWLQAFLFQQANTSFRVQPRSYVIHLSIAQTDKNWLLSLLQNYHKSLGEQSALISIIYLLFLSIIPCLLFQDMLKKIKRNCSDSATTVLFSINILSWLI